MDNYSRGNDFATIKIFEQKICWYKFLVDFYSRGNDFAAIKKNFDKNFSTNFKWVTILEELILQR